jgi:hypothetical protein
MTFLHKAHEHVGTPSVCFVFGKICFLWDAHVGTSHPFHSTALEREAAMMHIYAAFRRAVTIGKSISVAATVLT